MYTHIINISYITLCMFSQVLQANRDTNTIVDRPLVPAIIASKIRLVPYSGHPRMVCLRAEIIGCYHYGKNIFAI